LLSTKAQASIEQTTALSSLRRKFLLDSIDRYSLSAKLPAMRLHTQPFSRLAAQE